MSEKSCMKCKDIEQRLHQHEQTITQLLEIIAVTNRKLTDLDLRQATFEKSYAIHSHHPGFSVTPESSQDSSNMLRTNE